MSVISIRKGLDLPLKGTPEQKIHSAPTVRTVALIGRDYLGLRPKMAVAEGDRVTAGQPLFSDKHDPAVKYTSPGTGTVESINRGARRVLQSVIIKLDDPGDDPNQLLIDSVSPSELSAVSAERVRDALCMSGIWTAFRTRPYSKVPLSDATPASIFVTAMDTNPLAADPAVIVGEHADDFRAGLTLLPPEIYGWNVWWHWQALWLKSHACYVRDWVQVRKISCATVTRKSSVGSFQAPCYQADAPTTGLLISVVITRKYRFSLKVATANYSAG